MAYPERSTADAAWPENDHGAIPGSASIAVRIGVVPAVISVVCRRVITPSARSRLSLTGETFTAAESRTPVWVSIVRPRDDAIQLSGQMSAQFFPVEGRGGGGADLPREAAAPLGRR